MQAMEKRLLTGLSKIVLGSENTEFKECWLVGKMKLFECDII
jgi:hypothetical protein